MKEDVFVNQFNKKIGHISHVIHPHPNHVAAVQRTADLYWGESLFKRWVRKIHTKYILLFRLQRE